MKVSNLFRNVAKTFDIEFGAITKEISHNLKSGEAREHALREILKKYLPQRIGIDQGFIIDTQGRESKQIDIVVYDKTVATIFEASDIKYFPCEVVLAVGEVKSDIDSTKKLLDALDKIKSVKELDRSNQGKNLIITGPGISLNILKFDPKTQHRDQILGFIFTRSSMTRESILGVIQKYNSKIDRRFWFNILCAYNDFIISYESEKGLIPSAMDAKSIYCTHEKEVENLLLLFVSILSTFINEAHVARPNYFDYTNIGTTRHSDHPLNSEEK